MDIRKLKNGNYEIDERTLELLLDSYYTMEALQQGGVDNWSYYGEAINEYMKEAEENRNKKFEYWDELIEDIMNKIE